MYARVTSVQVKSDQLGEFARIFRESTVPVAKDQDGFKGALVLGDPGTNKTIVISLWESEADMLKAENSGYYQEQIAKRAPTFDGSPIRERYEVLVQALLN